MDAVAKAAPPIWQSVSQEQIDEIVQRIVRALSPEKIILFGAYARGTPTLDSDVDLLVIWDTDQSPLERYMTVSSLLIPRQFPMDILVHTPAEIEQ